MVCAIESKITMKQCTNFEIFTQQIDQKPIVLHFNDIYFIGLYNIFIFNESLKTCRYRVCLKQMFGDYVEPSSSEIFLINDELREFVIILIPYIHGIDGVLLYLFSKIFL